MVHHAKLTMYDSIIINPELISIIYYSKTNITLTTLEILGHPLKMYEYFFLGLLGTKM